jgi:uncharacterized membrane protein YbhN (UPF0104 family)
MVLLSAGITLATFGLLIETWRRMLLAWGETLSFIDAARIWFVQNLVRYLPGGFVVALGAMAELSRRRRISPTAATGAAVINTAVNIASGFVIALAAGFQALDVLSNKHAALYAVAAGVMLAGLLLLPDLLPMLLALARRSTGRDLSFTAPPRRAIYIAIVGNLMAWALYGLAYRALIAGVIGQAQGATANYVAVYAAAYVIGYLAFLLPAGAGVREAVQLNALPMLGLTTGPQAGLIAISARLLSMILEIIPGLLFLMGGTRFRPQAPTPTSLDGSTR